METILAFTIFFSNPASFHSPADSLLREEYSFGSFGKATRLAVSPQGFFYIVDEGRSEIQVVKATSESPVITGGYGWSSTTFDRPTGIATDGLNVYVSDYGNHRIQRFDRNLAYLSSLATRDTSVHEARFGYPTGVALSQSGDLFVLDGENYRVLRFSQDARFQQTFGGTETGNRKITNPLKIVVSHDNTIYVAESTRILEFDYFGNLVRIVGEGILQGVRSCDATPDALLALSKESLIWFSRDRATFSRIPLVSLITSEPIQDPQDLVVVGKKLYLLDAKWLHVFSIVEH